MIKKVDFAFVWEEEQGKLAEYADSVPDRGTILEIGTALGGTATIFHQACCGRKIKIYTVDVLGSKRAEKNLKKTDVSIIRQSSGQFAQFWKHKLNPAIDLLFIDGGHEFYNVACDFANWLPLVSIGGRIVFHDYDPPERGGIAHLGVKICVDTIIREKVLKSVKQEYKLFSGIKESDWKTLTKDHYFFTFKEIYQKILDSRQRIFSGSVEDGFKIIRERTVEFDSVQACYFLDYALKMDFEYIDGITHSFYEFRRWYESLCMFEHSNVEACFLPDGVFEIPELADYNALSRIIAREQVRLTFLSMILKTLVRWEV